MGKGDTVGSLICGRVEGAAEGLHDFFVDEVGWGHGLLTGGEAGREEGVLGWFGVGWGTIGEASEVVAVETVGGALIAVISEDHAVFGAVRAVGFVRVAGAFAGAAWLGVGVGRGPEGGGVGG